MLSGRLTVLFQSSFFCDILYMQKKKSVLNFFLLTFCVCVIINIINNKHIL